MSLAQFGNFRGPHAQLYGGFNRRHNRGFETARHNAQQWQNTAANSNQKRGQRSASLFVQRRAATFIENKVSVDDLEKITSVWHCKECGSDIEISGEQNQAHCKTCHAKHLEAPSHPRRGIILAR